MSRFTTSQEGREEGKEEGEEEGEDGREGGKEERRVAMIFNSSCA